MDLKKIDTADYTIYFSEEGYKYLADYVKEKKYSKIFVLSDTHTHECCVYTFLQKFPFEVEIIEVEAGEEHKNLDTCLSLWQTLSDLEADRKSYGRCFHWRKNRCRFGRTQEQNRGD